MIAIQATGMLFTKRSCDAEAEEKNQLFQCEQCSLPVSKISTGGGNEVYKLKYMPRLTRDERSKAQGMLEASKLCLLYTSPSPRDLSTSRMPSSA